MSVQAIQPGPVWPVVGGIIYALPGSACEILSPGSLERSNLYSGPFVAWSGGYNHVGGFVRPTSEYNYSSIKDKDGWFGLHARI